MGNGFASHKKPATNGNQLAFMSPNYGNYREPTTLKEIDLLLEKKGYRIHSFIWHDIQQINVVNFLYPS
jgi:hypothetical protein